MVIKLAETNLETLSGTFTEVLYYNGQKEFIALYQGDIAYNGNVLCRVHSSCLSAHVFNSTQCDCREQFAAAQHEIQKAGKGIIIWMDQEGKSNGHFALMKTTLLKNQGIYQTDAYEALGFQKDARDFTPAAEILSDLKVKSIILMTNNPNKVKTLTSHGITITDTHPLIIEPDPQNTRLKHALLGKMKVGHQIHLNQ